MNTEAIVSALNEEITKLTTARDMLGGKFKTVSHSTFTNSEWKPVARASAKKTRHISAAGRARIAAAQKARWAKQKKVVKAAKTTKPAPKAEAKAAA